MLPTKFGSFGQAVSEKIKKKLANQKQELPVAAMFVNRSEQDASYQISVHLAERFPRRKLKCEMLMDDRQTPSDGKSSQCLWQGELIKTKDFLPQA